ncbi:hypothetical protein [Sphingopyxis fribergensis]
MISVPAFTQIGISDYGLYPGREGAPGLHASVLEGLTLIVGANGLGKTTLITLLYRMLSGPFDIPNLTAGEELGTRRLEATALPPFVRSQFAARVSDQAKTARATVSIIIGGRAVQIERGLNNLALLQVTVEGEILANLTEDAYQELICGLAGVGSFGDFLLMLRYLVFYFEDRRALVWDQSAQRQLLRMLFLPPDQAKRWTEMEREILVEDSQVRNFQAVVGREEKSLNKNLVKAASASTLKVELEALEVLQENSREKIRALGEYTADLDNRRQQSRASFLASQQEREARFRAVEAAKLVAIQSRFPEKAATGRYILAHLMTEHDCLVCGTHVPDVAKEYAKRVESDECVVCATPLGQAEGIVEAREVADERVKRRTDALIAAERTLDGDKAANAIAEAEFDEHRRTLAILEAETAERANRIDALALALPPSEVAMRSQRDDLARLRAQFETRKENLAILRSEFAEFVAERTDDLLRQSEVIVSSFAEYASAFLSERTALTWSTYRARVGQTGDLINFPSFGLEMTGSDFGDTVKRTGPADVSESQREFIDLAFRMALMRAATDNEAGTLIIDTPESSLDAVFAKRAGQVLLRFSDQPGNHLIVTSNLVEGSLIPTLVDGIKLKPNPKDRLVDLFLIARPTAAVQEEAEEYGRVRKRLLGDELI